MGCEHLGGKKNGMPFPHDNFETELEKLRCLILITFIMISTLTVAV